MLGIYECYGKQYPSGSTKNTREDIAQRVKLAYTNPLLEGNDFFVRESISLGNDGDEVNFGMKSPHKLNIDLFKTK